MILTTCPTIKSEELIDEILKFKLAGCVLIVPIAKSKFWWKGRIEEEKEYLIIFKTADELVDELSEKVKELHPYETPYIAEVDVKKVNEDYLRWLKEVTVKEFS